MTECVAIQPCCASLPAKPFQEQYVHPLDPLSEREIELAVAIIQKDASVHDNRTTEGLRFIEICLYESAALREATFFQCRDKDEKNIPSRQAKAITWNALTNHTVEYVVCLQSEAVLDKSLIPDVQPAVDGYEYQLCEEIVKGYLPFQESLIRRGYTVEDAVVDAWCPGHFSESDGPSKRLLKPMIFVRRHSENIGYGSPLEGISVTVDMSTKQVTEYTDDESIPVPQRDPHDRYLNEDEFRTGLKPLHIVQPEGPSFQVHGQQVSWQKWSFRVGFTAREGLILYCVEYQDQANEAREVEATYRPICYRMGFSEMVVPYGDPNAPHYRKNAFDCGEDGLGKNANSLTFGCDCLGYIHYFDAHLVEYAGGVRTISNAICLHEEDFGVLWKHTDWRTEDTQMRRSRRLVISFFATVANYDYGFYIYFYQDGKIEYQVKLTGALSTGAIRSAATLKYGTEIAPTLYAPSHHHFFVVRMDMAVDGRLNSVSEVEARVDEEGEHNPYSNGFIHEEKTLEREGDGSRVVDYNCSRFWKLYNVSKRNRTGKPTAYKLMPQTNILPFARKHAAYLRRAGFLSRHVWVTPYNEREMYASGNYPNQNPSGDGLHRWVEQDRNIVDQDLVLWYVFGVHHIPREEDWPVMPVECCGFYLKPSGFFDYSPAMDVPPQTLIQAVRKDHCKKHS